MSSCIFKAHTFFLIGPLRKDFTDGLYFLCENCFRSGNTSVACSQMVTPRVPGICTLLIKVKQLFKEHGLLCQSQIFSFPLLKRTEIFYMVTARMLLLSLMLLLAEASELLLLTHLLQMTCMRAILLGMTVFTSFLVLLISFRTYFALTSASPRRTQTRLKKYCSQNSTCSVIFFTKKDLFLRLIILLLLN